MPHYFVCFCLYSRRVGGHSPDVEPPSEERDKRTVMCMQLSAHVGPSELEEFFQKVGQVKEVKMIADKNSRRSKGIAYVEFHDEKSIPGVSKERERKVTLCWLVVVGAFQWYI